MYKIVYRTIFIHSVDKDTAYDLKDSDKLVTYNVLKNANSDAIKMNIANPEYVFYVEEIQ